MYGKSLETLKSKMMGGGRWVGADMSHESFLTGETHDSNAGGWKTLHVWTEGSVYRGPSIRGPSRQLEEQIVNALLSVDRESPRTLVMEDGRLDKAVLARVVKDAMESHWHQQRQRAREQSVLKQFHGSLQQDAWVVLLFQGMRQGFFVDLAAFDSVSTSNTFALERDYGWRGSNSQQSSRY